MPMKPPQALSPLPTYPIVHSTHLYIYYYFYIFSLTPNSSTFLPSPYNTHKSHNLSSHPHPHMVHTSQQNTNILIYSTPTPQCMFPKQLHFTQQTIKDKLLLSIYSQLCVVQYGKFGRRLSFVKLSILPTLFIHFGCLPLVKSENGFMMKDFLDLQFSKECQIFTMTTRNVKQANERFPSLGFLKQRNKTTLTQSPKWWNYQLNTTVHLYFF